MIVAAAIAIFVGSPWSLQPIAVGTTQGAAIKAAPPVGDSCLIGRWIGSKESAPGDWTWNNEVVAVSGLTGFVLTFSAGGSETYDLAASQPLIGDYHGHQIKIVVRGSVTYRIHADGSHFVQSGRSGRSTVTFFYDGVLQPGGTVSFPLNTISYACGAQSLQIRSPAGNAGYGPTVDDLTRSAASPSASQSVISSVGSTLATPADLLHAPMTLLVNALIALALVLLVTFPSHLFNRTYEENHVGIRAWWERRLPWLKRLRAKPAKLRAPIRADASFVVVVLSGGVLAALLDPQFGPNLRTLALLVGAALALTAGFAVGAIAAGLYRVARHRAGPWQLHALPSGLVVAAFCVLISRLTDFQPGYLYGLIGGVAFARSLSEREEGHVVALTSVVTLLVSVAAWLLWVPVSAASSADPTGFGWALLSNFLAALFVSGTVGLLISLVPLRFLPGEKLARWHRWAWGSVFGLAGLAVIEVMLRPQSAGAHVASVPFWTTAILFVGFGAASLVFWGYFRMSKPAVTAGASNVESGRDR